LYDILRNEKYCGIYIYNKSVAVDKEGKFNRHASKPGEQIIRIDGGIPQIISKEDFAKAQEKMRERKHKTAQFKARQEYLLSGKIICGECGATYAGNSRKTRDKLYISYTCTKKNGKTDCYNSGIQRDYIESVVLENLSEKVFNAAILPEIIEKYNDYALKRNKGYSLLNEELKLKLSETQRQIKNIVNYVATTGSSAMLEKLTSLEQEQTCLENAIAENEAKKNETKIDAKQIKLAFNKAKRMLKIGELKNKKAIVQQFVKLVIVYKDKITIEYNITDDYAIKEEIIR
jgi:site-specific DNA recombinase